MTREEIRNTPEIVDFMIDKSVIADSRMKLHKRMEELCKLAIKALEQKPCNDTVSREDAKSFLYERLNRLNNDELYDIFSVIIDDMYNELPSVQPKKQMDPS